MTAPLLVLNLGTPPRSGNRALRQHWSSRRREAKDWSVRILDAYADALVTDFRALRAMPSLANPLTVTTRRRVVVRWTAPRPPDEDNALTACKPILDCLLRVQRRKVGGRMVEVPGVVRVLWDDSPDHLVIEYAPARGSPRHLALEVYDG